jgi:hypothetical protein
MDHVHMARFSPKYLSSFSYPTKVISLASPICVMKEDEKPINMKAEQGWTALVVTSESKVCS